MSQSNSSRGLIGREFKNLGDEATPRMQRIEYTQSHTPEIRYSNNNSQCDDSLPPKGSMGDKLIIPSDMKMANYNHQNPSLIKSEMSSVIFSPQALFNNGKSMDNIMESRKKKLAASSFKKSAVNKAPKEIEESQDEYLTYTSEIHEFATELKSDKEEENIEVKYSKKWL